MDDVRTEPHRTAHFWISWSGRCCQVGLNILTKEFDYLLDDEISYFDVLCPLVRNRLFGNGQECLVVKTIVVI